MYFHVCLLQESVAHISQANYKKKRIFNYRVYKFVAMLVFLSRADWALEGNIKAPGSLDLTSPFPPIFIGYICNLIDIIP